MYDAGVTYKPDYVPEYRINWDEFYCKPMKYTFREDCKNIELHVTKTRNDLGHCHYYTCYSGQCDSGEFVKRIFHCSKTCKRFIKGENNIKEFVKHRNNGYFMGDDDDEDDD